VTNDLCPKAKESGVSFSSIHNYVMERRKPSFANVLKIARALGTTCEAFAGCEDLQDEAEAPKGRPRKAAAPGRPAKGKKGGGKG